MENSVNQKPMNKSWSLIFRYYSHCLKMHVYPGLCNDFVLLIKTFTVLFSPQLFHYFFINFASSSVCRASENQSDKKYIYLYLSLYRYIFKLPLRLSML